LPAWAYNHARGDCNDAELDPKPDPNFDTELDTECDSRCGRSVGLPGRRLGFGGWSAGCRIHVDKGANGEDKHVQIDMPFADSCEYDETTAADLACRLSRRTGGERDDKHKSADVHMAWRWEMRVKVVSYSTPTARTKLPRFTRRRSLVMRRDHLPE